MKRDLYKELEESIKAAGGHRRGQSSLISLPTLSRPEIGPIAPKLGLFGRDYRNRKRIK